MEIGPYLNFNGQCAAAFKAYERILGGSISTMLTYGESPMAEQFPEMRQAVLHATLTIGDRVLMGADAPPNQYDEPKGFAVSLALNDPAEAERVFKSLSENGTVRMPLQKTFWSPAFGMLVDQYGIPWMINCEEGRRA
ncbi:MAG TPA: VOC family protein [Blastocatellia bacterium]